MNRSDAAPRKPIAGGISAGFAVEEAREYAENIIDTVREPLIILDKNLRVVTASRSLYEVFKVRPEETVGQLSSLDLEAPKPMQ